jgi:hypothetical protein
MAFFVKQQTEIEFRWEKYYVNLNYLLLMAVGRERGALIREWRMENVWNLVCCSLNANTGSSGPPSRPLPPPHAFRPPPPPGHCEDKHQLPEKTYTEPFRPERPLLVHVTQTEPSPPHYQPPSSVLYSIPRAFTVTSKIGLSRQTSTEKMSRIGSWLL